ncbi:MAG: serine acetyltransferase [Christensenella sp.]|nr:serine acetyltransferase [Christensenella sp.]
MLFRELQRQIKLLFCFSLLPEDCVWIGRLLAARNARGGRFVAWLCGRAMKKIRKLYGIEICSFENIGENLVMVHPYCITVNPKTIIGDNCVLFKGCTIGSIRSGKRMGVPIIENNVAICTNASIFGGIRIGHDSLIAANSFVNLDVPLHSVVLGNPATIHHKENASSDYCSN